MSRSEGGDHRNDHIHTTLQPGAVLSCSVLSGYDPLETIQHDETHSSPAHTCKKHKYSQIFLYTSQAFSLSNTITVAMCKQVVPVERESNTRSSNAQSKKPIIEMLNESKNKSVRSRSVPPKKSVSEAVGESKSKPRSSTPKKSDGGVNRAAFRGGQFDKQGYCIIHSTVQLADPIIGPDGKIIYQELKASCRSCQSAKHKSKRGTSLSGGKVQERPRRPSMSGKKSKRYRSRSMERRKDKPVYSTPFDDKGRCHYHKNVQLAGKKMTGGWKVIHSICPKCMEDNSDEDDNLSVKSGKSNRSSRTGLSVGSSGNAHGQYDRKGRCVLHSHMQVAKKKTFGHGWKVLRVCPACDGGEHTSMDDAVSVSSRSVSSRKSSRSVTSSSSRGKKVSSGRYGTLPFDGEGYCFQHPSIMMAQKKMMGGFKIIMDVCPECAIDRGIESNKKKSARRKSGTGSVFDDSGSECSSVISKISGSSSVSKKKVRVKNMKFDGDGKAGKYSGYVNDDYMPHGNGAIHYIDGSTWSGAWYDGSQVAGKFTRSSRSKSKN